MILADTSLWIDWIRDPDARRRVRDGFSQLVTCGPVLQEVLQGIEDSPATRLVEDFIQALPSIADPLPMELFIRAAEIYRDGRRRGYTIRSSMDCLIAAIAIEHGVTVWHKDRDFDFIARYTRLQVRSEYVS